MVGDEKKVDPEWTKRIAREIANEFLLTHIYNMVLRMHRNVSEKTIAELEGRMLAEMDLISFGGRFDPATSDLMAGEFQDAIRDLLDSARQGRRVPRQGKEFIPEE